MYNGVVIPQLDTNNTENLIYTLYLDWNLYQLTDNASYEADALLRANEFIAAYNPTQLMSNLGTPDRELGLFLQMGSRCKPIKFITTSNLLWPNNG